MSSEINKQFFSNERITMNRENQIFQLLSLVQITDENFKRVFVGRVLRKIYGLVKGDYAKQLMVLIRSVRQDTQKNSNIYSPKTTNNPRKNTNIDLHIP